MGTHHILIILQSRNGHRSYLRHHHISQTNANRPKVAIIYCAGCQNFASSHTTHKKKHCQRNNGLRLLSLKLELSWELKRIQIPVLALLAFLHSLVTTFPTSMSSTSSTAITFIMAKQPILSPKISQRTALTFHHATAPCCRPA